MAINGMAIPVKISCLRSNPLTALETIKNGKFNLGFKE